MKLIALLGLGVAAIVLVIVLRARSARAEIPKAGDLAPDFSTNAIVGDQTIPVRLDDYHGRPVVLYFYPKDGTPGCTKEACNFRDGYSKLARWGIVVLGCSVDNEDAHRAFAKKYSLPFPLLLDPDKKIARSYGVENGIPILGLDSRTTFVIGPDGRILKVYPKVDPAIHASEIIDELGANKEPPPSAASPTASPSSGPNVSSRAPQPSEKTSGTE
jgi:thioredoxin-dependent peroxiredoxin